MKALPAILNIFMKKRLFPIFFLSLCLQGCIFDSESDKIIGKYIVICIDIPQNQTISEQDEINSQVSATIIEPYVFSVGHNNDFIIAKQHPTNGFEGGYQVNKSVTNFYIIDINRKILITGNKYFGPLSSHQFDSLRSKLKIADVKFDMNYQE
jgi:hypothetical protein